LRTYAAAADPTNPTGVQAAPSTDGQPWYESDGAKQFGGALTGIQSLLAAIKTNRPLPIATSVFSLAATLSLDPQLGSISGGLNGLNSLVNFGDALERGDEIGALNSGAILLNSTYIQFYKSAVDAGISAYGGIDVAKVVAELGDEAAANLVQAAEFFANLAAVLPYLSFFNAVAQGDVPGSLAALAVILEVPYALPIAALYYILTFLFTPAPDIHGSAVAISSQDGVHVQASLTSDSDGGGAGAQQTMDSLINSLQNVLPELADMGIIAQRLPTLYYKNFSGGGGDFDLTFKDAQTGETYVRHYTQEGVFRGEGSGANVNPQTALVEFNTREDFFLRMGQQFLQAAFEAGAVAPS
jgi:hypothetical protein